MVSMSSNSLNVTSEDESRKDLAQRRETKFALPGVDAGKIRQMLLRHCEQQVHNESQSLVNSIYFDDHQLSACYANLDGLTSRRKLRLRWYDAQLPEHDTVLEIKWRENRITGKHRVHLRSETRLHELSNTDLIRLLQSTLSTRDSLEKHHAALLNYSQPTLLVRYQRQHFVSRDRRIRLTLDCNLQFVDQRGRSCLSDKFPEELVNFVVLEGKTPVGAENELRQLIHPFHLRATRCSKYVLGCQLLGMVPASA